MRTLTILSIVILLGSCQPKVQNGTILPSLDKKSLYPALFKAEPRYGWCLWKPTPAEEDSSNVSSDGFCHTRLDTILNYSDSGVNKAVIIFGTCRFDENGMVDCHACAPIVSVAVAQQNSDHYWRIQRFIKNFGEHGSWGQQPRYRITKFGGNYFLVEDWGYTNQGVTESWNIFWHLPSLVESLQIGGEDDSGWRENEKLVTHWDESIADASANKITKVLVHKKGKVYEESKGQYSFDSTRVYVLDDSCIFRTLKK
ncbi:MAG: hypothetical protein NTU98_08245 [Bacteroidetes bacterium]|nr:hypothetical protein [Bacteroidota bacterium]